MRLSSRHKLATIAVAGGMLVAGAAAAAADVNLSASGSVDPGVNATPPAVTLPSLTAPVVTAPSVTPPEMTQAPAVTGPEITKPPSVTGPQITKEPSVTAAPPSVAVSDDAMTVTVPFPQATGPGVVPGSVSGPEISQPSVSGPQISDPSVIGPQVSEPSVNGGVEVSDPSVAITPGTSIQASAGLSL